MAKDNFNYSKRRRESFQASLKFEVFLKLYSEFFFDFLLDVYSRKVISGLIKLLLFLRAKEISEKNKEKRFIISLYR